MPNKNDTNKIMDFIQGNETKGYRNSQLELLEWISLNTEETYTVTQNGFKNFDDTIQKMFSTNETNKDNDDSFFLEEQQKSNNLLSNIYSYMVNNNEGDVKLIDTVDKSIETVVNSLFNLGETIVNGVDISINKYTTKIKDSIDNIIGMFSKTPNQKDYIRTDDKLFLEEQQKSNNLLTNIYEFLEKKEEDGSILGTLFMFLGAFVATTVKKFKTIFSFIPKIFSKGFNKVFSVLKNSSFFNGLKNLFGGVKTKLVKVFSPIIKVFDKVIDSVKGVNSRFGKIFSPIIKTFKKIGNVIKSFSVSIGKFFKPISSIFSKGGGVVKAIGQFFKPLGNVFKLFGKFAPMLKFVKAIPIIGTAISLIFGVIDGIRGFFKAGEFFDVKESDLNIGQRISAIVGSIISGLTFGLLDPKKISNGIYSMFEPVVTSIIEVFSPTSDRNLFQRVMDVIRVFIGSISDTITSIFSPLFNNEDGSQGFFSGVISSISNYIVSIPQRISSVFGYLFSEETGLFSGFISSFGSYIALLPSQITNLVTSIFSDDSILIDISNSISNFFISIKDLFIEGFKKISEFDIGNFFFGESEDTSKISKKERVQDKPVEVKVQKPEPSEVVRIMDSDDPNVRQRNLMNFLLNEFSDVMAQKINAVDKGKNVNTVKAPAVQPFG